MHHHPILAYGPLFVALVFLSACGGDGGGSPAPPPISAPAVVVSGSVQAPGGQVAMFREATIWQQLAGVFLSEAMAGVSGVSPVPDGTAVQLVRINDAGSAIATLASTTVSAGRYSFNFTSLGLTFSSDLVVRVINQGIGAQMRAFVVGSTVNLDPVSEASVRLVLDQILLVPGTILSQFTVTELRDIAGAVNQLTTVKQATAGLNIETTVTTIKNLVAAEPGITSFIMAAAGAGQTTEGPGDIGNYFPLSVAQTWQFQGTHSETGQPTVNFSNAMTIKGPKPVGAVTTTILAESNPFNTGSEEEIYYLKDSQGILNYGNNDPADTLSPNLVPYRELVFPLNLDVTSEVVNKKGVNFGQDLDFDGKTETADVLSQVTVEKFEDVTVPKGTFTNTARVVHKTTITLFSSAGYRSQTVVNTQTVWFAPGIGPIKRQILLQEQGGPYVESVSEELTDFYAHNLGNPRTYPTNSQLLKQTVIGDLNGDGRNDVASSIEEGSTAVVYFQNAQGQFSTPVIIDFTSTINEVSRVAVGDLNGDGRSDLVLVGRCGPCGGAFLFSVVDVRYQDPGTGALVQGPTFSWLGTGVRHAGIGDLNSDGRKDLIVSSERGLSIFYQMANGSLGAPLVYDKLAGGPLGEIHIADIDHDGDNDIVAQSDLTQFAVIRQNASVLSDVPEYYNVPTTAFQPQIPLAVGDVNGDGRQDVVAVAYEGLFIYLQNNSGGLNPPTLTASVAGKIRGVRIADINLDGLSDVIQGGINDVYVYLQASDHSLGSPRPYPFQTTGWGGDWEAMATGDVTGDGKPDVVVGRSSGTYFPGALFVIPNITQ